MHISISVHERIIQNTNNRKIEWQIIIVKHQMNASKNVYINSTLSEARSGDSQVFIIEIRMSLRIRLPIPRSQMFIQGG